MVLLSDRELRKALESGRLGVDPFDPAMVQPSSIDVRLDRFFRVFDNSRYTHIDPQLRQDELTRWWKRTTKTIRSCCIRASSCSPRRSSSSPCRMTSRAGWRGSRRWGRLGLLTHSTAGFIDPGFSGHITLELSNVANLPITL